jgi:hypothetical protein
MKFRCNKGNICKEGVKISCRKRAIHKEALPSRVPKVHDTFLMRVAETLELMQPFAGNVFCVTSEVNN